MIRLGGLVGYAFEGPFPLAEWEVPGQSAVFAVLLAGAGQLGDEPEPGTVVALGHSDDLAGDGFPWSNPFAACWMQFAGSREALAVAVFLRCQTRRIRVTIADELAAFYEPPCGDYRSRWPDVGPPEEQPPGGTRVRARPRPPLLPPAAAAEEAVGAQEPS